MYDEKDLPEDIAITDAADSDRVITRLAVDRLPDWAKEALAGEGIWGAYRNDEGRVVVVFKDGEEIETDIEISPDGYVFA